MMKLSILALFSLPLFGQALRIYTALPSPCGSASTAAWLQVSGVYSFQICQGDGTWKAAVTQDVLTTALATKVDTSAQVTVPTAVGLLAINAASTDPLIATNSVLTNALCALTYFSTTSLCTATASDTLTLVSQGTTWTDPQVLTGNVDWAVPAVPSTGSAQAYQDRKSGGSIISSTYVQAGDSGGFSGSHTSWTDGTNSATGTQQAIMMTAGGNITLQLTPSSTTRTATLYFSQAYAGSATATVTAHSSNSGIADAVGSVTVGSNQTVVFSFSDSTAAPITFTISSLGAPAFYGWAAN